MHFEKDETILVPTGVLLSRRIREALWSGERIKLSVVLR